MYVCLYIRIYTYYMCECNIYIVQETRHAHLAQRVATKSELVPLAFCPLACRSKSALLPTRVHGRLRRVWMPFKGLWVCMCIYYVLISPPYIYIHTHTHTHTHTHMYIYILRPN